QSVTGAQGPWLKYQQPQMPPPTQGPWTKYAASSTAPSKPLTAADLDIGQSAKYATLLKEGIDPGQALDAVLHPAPIEQQPIAGGIPQAAQGWRELLTSGTRER